MTRDSLFDAQIDAEAWLRGRGWPEAQVFLKTVPSRKARRVDVEASLDPGPRVAVEFEGDPLPAASRRAVADLYRTGILEPSALEEMSLEARRALRALGHLDPRAEASATDAPGGRRVVVSVSAGRRVDIAAISFTGVSPSEAVSLARRFGTPLARVELAASLPSADGRLVQALRALGYPNGALVRRELSEDGGTLTVELDPSLPSLVDSVEVRGVPDEEARDLARRVLLSPGEPADADKASLSALAMEDALRERGFAEARVRVELSPATPEDPPRIAAVFAVEAGPAERVGTVSLEGLSRTSAPWARRAAGLEPGGVFRQDDLARAQADVFALGLFESVKASSVAAAGRRRRRRSRGGRTPAVLVRLRRPLGERLRARRRRRRRRPQRPRSRRHARPARPLRSRRQGRPGVRGPSRGAPRGRCRRVVRVAPDVARGPLQRPADRHERGLPAALANPLRGSLRPAVREVPDVPHLRGRPLLSSRRDHRVPVRRRRSRLGRPRGPPPRDPGSPRDPRPRDERRLARVELLVRPRLRAGQHLPSGLRRSGRVASCGPSRCDSGSRRPSRGRS